MTTSVRAYGATAAGKPLSPMTIERRATGDDDVRIEILYAGICHSDIHQARDEWGGGAFPMVPGHEIVGRVVEVGKNVTKLRPGDLAGVGCMVDSCRTCDACRAGLEQYCVKGNAPTYNGTEMDRTTPTFGGYSTHIVVAERFTLRVPKELDPAAAAPLLCAGITTYSPLKQLGCKPGDKVGVVGLGGLGHMAVKLAASMGADVTVLSTSRSKEADAARLGAKNFLVTKDSAAMARAADSLDILVDTVSAPHDYGAYLALLRARGTMAIVGAPPSAIPLHAFSLILGGKRLLGSLIGGIAETQEMLDHCAKHGIGSDVEIIPATRIDEAYERVLASDVRYRFVIDAATIAG